MKSKLYSIILLLFAMVFVNACSEDETYPDPAATFTTDKTTARVGEFVQFTNTSDNATAFRWSFGDGTMSSEISPRKAYDVTGVYTVSLVSTGKGGSVISSTTITVVPDALFEIEGSDHMALTPVKFKNLSKGATSYEWSFGNAGNSKSTEESPEFSYVAAGTYTVTLKAISATGESTFERQITINPSLSPDLYFIEFGASPVFVRKLSLDGSGTITNFFDMTEREGLYMAYHAASGRVFFTGLDADDDGKVWSINIDGTGLTVVASGLWDPYGIAIDAVNNKLYVADVADGDDYGHIYRANFDGSGLEAIVTMEAADFTSVSVDPANNKIYFMDLNNENIHVANLDGSNESVLIPGAWGYMLMVDTKHGKLYYEHQRVIKRADLTGANIEIVDNSANTPTTTQARCYGMVIDTDEDKIYWSGRDSNSIMKANLDGTGKEILKSGLSSPRGIFLRK